jgi:NRPS condensation-like uncharacterized protein
MAVPLDGIRAIHHAFRKDLTAIDSSAYLSARQGSNTEGILRRYSFFNEVLVWHASGEEENVFPAVDKVAPLIAEAYERDHRGLDNLYISLNKAVMGRDKLDIARATAVFNFHLQFHLNKEEAHLYRVFNERISLADQGVIIGKMAQKIPQERFPEVIAWLFPLIGPDDQENMTRIWQQALPNPVFAKVIKLVQTAIGNDWTELTRRIPELK